MRLLHCWREGKQRRVLRDGAVNKQRGVVRPLDMQPLRQVQMEPMEFIGLSNRSKLLGAD